MNMTENLRRKENGIIFAPNYGDFDLNIRCNAHNIGLWSAKNPNYLDWFTKDGIRIGYIPTDIVSKQYRMHRALKVVTLDRRIRAWLTANDPMALKQCEDALKGEIK